MEEMYRASTAEGAQSFYALLGEHHSPSTSMCSLVQKLIKFCYSRVFIELNFQPNRPQTYGAKPSSPTDQRGPIISGVL